MKITLKYEDRNTTVNTELNLDNLMIDDLATELALFLKRCTYGDSTVDKVILARGFNHPMNAEICVPNSNKKGKKK